VEAEKAATLDPYDANALGLLGLWVAFTGHWDEGTALAADGEASLVPRGVSRGVRCVPAGIYRIVLAWLTGGSKCLIRSTSLGCGSAFAPKTTLAVVRRGPCGTKRKGHDRYDVAGNIDP
jgi:hypothetical protein